LFIKHFKYNINLFFLLGTSDPFVVIKLLDGVTKQRHKTKTIQKTLNPTWNETFEL